MAYKYTYINKLDQFSSISYTLVLEDEDGIMPVIRNDKNFSKSKFPTLMDEHLEEEAQKDIEIYTNQYLDNQEI